MKNADYVTRSIDLHLFFLRIMKEHMLFIEAAFTPQNFGLQEQASRLRERANELFTKVVSVANGNVSPDTLESGEAFTKYTIDAEEATAYFTKIPIDTSITAREHSLMMGQPQFTGISVNDMGLLNNEIYNLVTNIISYKTELLNQVSKCSLFTMNYPLLIDHILREAKHYQEAIVKLNNDSNFIDQRELLQEEVFWNRIMAEHSKFIRGLLDPTEEQLIEISNTFANKFDELTKAAKAAEQSTYQLAGLTNQTLEETKKIKEFKTQGTEGLLTCKIKSIIVPLLADHVLRESNHYLKILKCYDVR